MIGGFCGALALSGLGLMRYSYLDLRPSLVNRVLPYLGSSKENRLEKPVNSWFLWFSQILGYVGSSQKSVSRRLQLAGKDDAITSFRLGQLVALVLGGVLGVMMGLVGWFGGRFTLGGLIMFTFFGALLGVIGADMKLTYAAKSRQLSLLQELPDLVEIIALAVGAGMQVGGAIAHVGARGSGVAAREMVRVGQDINSAIPLYKALKQLSDRNDCVALMRLVDAINTAMERGSPLAEVLRDQALDAREVARQALIADAGRRDIAMLIPVVFLIMPVTVVFALYPGLIALRLGY